MGSKNTTSIAEANVDRGILDELHEALGVSSPELARTLLIQTACASEVKGFADLQGCKSLAPALRGIGPRDELEPFTVVFRWLDLAVVVKARNQAASSRKIRK